MKKIFSLLVALLTLNQVSAYSPFDILHQNEPDFIIKGISQENNSNQITINVCNIWWSMDQYWDLALGVQNISRNWYQITTLVKNIRLSSWNCTNYRVWTIDSLWILSNWYYNLKWQVKLQYYLSERDRTNNYYQSNVNISVWSYYYNSNYNYNYNNNYNSYNNYNYSSYNLPDLSIRNLDYYEKTTISEYNTLREVNNAIVAEICNDWSSFNSYWSLRVNFRWPNNKDNIVYINSGNSTWNSGECRKTAVSTYELWIWYSTSYNVTVKVDDNSSVNERNESNNSMTKYLYIPYNSNYNYYYNNNYNNNYNSSNSSYYCNGTKYNRINNASWYNCNGNHYYYNTNNSQYNSDSNYNSNYDNNSENYGKVYCDWNREYIYNDSGKYYCDGARHTLNENNTNYYNNYNTNNNYDRYNCNWSRYNYTNNASSYYCNWSRYSRNR